MSGGTEICASPKAIGTHSAGVAERSTTGRGLVLDGTVVVGAFVWELVQAARVSPNVTSTRTRSLTLLMLPRSFDGLGSR
jgi:hypothetical protein